MFIVETFALCFVTLPSGTIVPIFIGFLRVPGGCPRGGGNWGTLRIPLKIGEP